MKSAWETDQGHLACRWSETGARLPYRPQWLEQASGNAPGNLPPPPPDSALDLARISPFGGSDWYGRGGSRLRAGEDR